jgi:hypothetical protein
MRTSLTLQQRSEILGPPPLYGTAAAAVGSSPEDIARRLKQGRIVLLQDVLSPFDVQDTLAAIAPELPFGPPVSLAVKWPAESWVGAAQEQEALIDDVIRRSRETRARFAVFSLAPIPLAIHLGHLLSDRIVAELFQYDRERQTWCWDEGRAGDAAIGVDGLPPQEIAGPTEVIVRVSLSATIRPADAVLVAGDCPVQVDLSVAHPDVMWLCHPGQIAAVERTFREVLRVLNRAVPDCVRIHVFYAGPTAGAIAIGRAINPRMNPEVALYEFHKARTPRYERVLTLNV